MKNLMWHITKDECQALQYSCLSINYWCLAETVADITGVPGFVDVLALFIKQEHIKVKVIASIFNKCHKDNDLS